MAIDIGGRWRRDHSLLPVGLTLGRTCSSGGERWDGRTDQLWLYQNWTTAGKEKIYLKRVLIFSWPLQTPVRVCSNEFISHQYRIGLILSSEFRQGSLSTTYTPNVGTVGRPCNVVPSFTEPSLKLLQ